MHGGKEFIDIFWPAKHSLGSPGSQNLNPKGNMQISSTEDRKRCDWERT